MAFSAAGNSGRPLADINVTPLVDVMLVLLIIFIVTTPMVAMPIAVDLPQHTNKIIDRPEPPPPIEVRVDAGNQLYWNGQPLARADVQSRLAEQAQIHAGNVPELRSAASPDAQYEVMAQVLAAANNAHMERIAFVQ
ncbi:MAG: ExbD/TolR family protein [Stenotrophomonas sp.]|uniref:ExbD/TolR family protein n=1 Tax=Stenotrophomonas sp. TaxID=69392 RepID=UPI003D6CB511